MSRPRRRQRRFALVATAALAIAGLFSAAAEAAPPPGQVRFTRPDPVPEVRAQHRGLRGPLQQRAGDGPGSYLRRLGGGDRQASLPQRRLQRGGAAELRAGLRDQGARRRTHAALSLLRALPAQRLPHIYLHPLRAGVPEVLLGGPWRLAVRDHLRQARGAGLVVPRSGLRDQGASERERPLVESPAGGRPTASTGASIRAPPWRWRQGRLPRPAATGQRQPSWSAPTSSSGTSTRGPTARATPPS